MKDKGGFSLKKRAYILGLEEKIEPLRLTRGSDDIDMFCALMFACSV